MTEETPKSRILKALRVAGVSQSDLADELGIDRASVSEMLKKAGDPPTKYLKATAKLTDFRLEWLMTGDGHEVDKPLVHIPYPGDVREASESYLKGKKIEVRQVVTTVDARGRDLISMVHVKAQAGYLRGYGDPHFIEKLPAFNLPIIKGGGQYRMFEVDGDSMLQIGGGGLHDGDIVISQYVEDIFSIKDRRVYVVISTEGVCVKRVLNRLKDKEHPVLICQSDNKNGQHADIIVRAHEIIEVWELKAYISRQLGFASDIWEILNNIEARVALQDQKIEKIANERLLGG